MIAALSAQDNDFKRSLVNLVLEGVSDERLKFIAKIIAYEPKIKYESETAKIANALSYCLNHGDIPQQFYNVNASRIRSNGAVESSK